MARASAVERMQALRKTARAVLAAGSAMRVKGVNSHFFPEVLEAVGVYFMEADLRLREVESFA